MMEDNLESPQTVEPQTVEPQAVEPQPEKKKGIPKIAWIAGGCGLLLVIVLVVAGGLALYFGPLLFGGDPIPAAVPNNSLLYASVDLRQALSGNFNRVVNAFQYISGEDQTDMVTSLDTTLEEYQMTFDGSVKPWLGRYGAFVMVEGDLNNGTGVYMFILQSRNNGKADQFVKDLVAALEDKQGKSFEVSPVSGGNLYIARAQRSYEQDQVIARVGKFVYFSNSELAVRNSIQLKKNDSLAGSKAYKDTLAALPKGRLATMYFGGEAYSTLMSDAMDQSFLGASSLGGLGGSGFQGMAMSASAVDAGLRMDVVITYDESKLTDFQKATLSAAPQQPTTADLVPGDTVLYLGSNSTLSPSRYLESDSPLYTADLQDSFDLLDQEYGINIQELLDLLGGEVGLALAPSQDSLLSQIEGPQIGLMLLLSTTDEAAMDDWIDNALQTVADQTYLEYQVRDTQFGDYNLHSLSLQSGIEQMNIFTYGSDNGYFVLGLGEDMLNKGLGGGGSLADNPTYQDTWKAFSSGSVPYFYLDMGGLYDALNYGYYYGTNETLVRAVNRIPVIAAAVNPSSGYAQSFTLIAFINDK
jgi:hypothetical protein